MSKAQFLRDFDAITSEIGYRPPSPEVVYAQADFETGGFTSSLYAKHNWFGMKAPNSRRLYTGIQNGFATYSKPIDSLRDYLLRQKQFGVNISSNEAYIESTLRSGYVPENERTQYAAGWAARYKKHTGKVLNLTPGSASNSSAGSSSSGPIVVPAVAATLLTRAKMFLKTWQGKLVVLTLALLVFVKWKK